MSLMNSPVAEKRKRLFLRLGALVAVLLVTLGVFAKNGWFPSGPDPFTGKRTGWFGAPLAKNAGSSWNPLAAPLPTPTPQLSKEYIHTGSRLLAVVDANAQEAPPADLAIWRPSNGEWWVLGGSEWSHQIGATWGGSNDDPVEGDYDGDGKTDFAVWRKTNSPGASDAGNWYIVYSSDTTTAANPFGQVGDITAQADYS